MYRSKFDYQYNGRNGTDSMNRTRITETEHPRIPLPTNITAFHPFDTHRLDTIVSACPQIALETNCNLELWDTRTDASRVYSQLQIVGYRKKDIQKARKAIGDVALRAEEEIMAAYRQRDQNVKKVEPVARYFYYMSREARETILGRNNERLAGIVASAKCSIVEPVVVRVNDENPPIFIGGSVDAVKKAKQLLDEQFESYRETRKRAMKNQQSPERSAMLSSPARSRHPSTPKSNNQQLPIRFPSAESIPLTTRLVEGSRRRTLNSAKSTAETHEAPVPTKRYSFGKGRSERSSTPHYPRPEEERKLSHGTVERSRSRSVSCERHTNGTVHLNNRESQELCVSVIHNEAEGSSSSKHHEERPRKNRETRAKSREKVRETREETDEEFRRRLLEADRIHFFGQPGPAEFIGRRPPTHNDFHPISTIYSEVVKSVLGSIARTTGCELEMMEPSAFVSYQKIGMNGSDEEIRKAHELLDDFIMTKESGRVNEDGEKTVCRFLHVPPDIKEKLFKEEHEKWKTILRTSGVLCEKVRNKDDDNAPFLLRGKLRYMEELNMMITSFLDDIRNGVTETFYVQNEDVERILASNRSLIRTLSRSTVTNVEVERRSRRITVRGRKSSVTKAMINLDELVTLDVRFDVNVPENEYHRVGNIALLELEKKSVATFTTDDVPRDGLVRIACRGSLRDAHYAKHLAEIEFGIIEKDAEFRPTKDRKQEAVDPILEEDERNRRLLEILGV